VVEFGKVINPKDVEEGVELVVVFIVQELVKQDFKKVSEEEIEVDDDDDVGMKFVSVPLVKGLELVRMSERCFFRSERVPGGVKIVLPGDMGICP